MKVRTAHYATPVNSRHGYYVQVEASYAEIRSGAARDLATTTAQAAGWAPILGQAGAPVHHGNDVNTMAFWFYQRAI